MPRPFRRHADAQSPAEPVTTGEQIRSRVCTLTTRWTALHLGSGRNRPFRVPRREISGGGLVLQAPSLWGLPAASRPPPSLESLPPPCNSHSSLLQPRWVSSRMAVRASGGTRAAGFPSSPQHGGHDTYTGFSRASLWGTTSLRFSCFLRGSLQWLSCGQSWAEALRTASRHLDQPFCGKETPFPHNPSCLLPLCFKGEKQDAVQS